MKQSSAQRKRVTDAIRLVYSSMESHLDYSHKPFEKMCESCGDRKFHAEAVKEYAYIIHVLAEHL